MTIEEKLSILTDAAKYDVSCSSSGSTRTESFGSLGATHSSGICHAFSADGRCISLLKILFPTTVFTTALTASTVQATTAAAPPSHRVKWPI